MRGHRARGRHVGPPPATFPTTRQPTKENEMKEDTASALASHALSEAMVSINTKDQPEPVKLLVDGFAGSVGAVIDSGKQLESDYRELAANADMVPRQGL